MYNHYLSVAEALATSEPGVLDTDLLNYVRRAEGAMPWTQLAYGMGYQLSKLRRIPARSPRPTR